MRLEEICWRFPTVFAPKSMAHGNTLPLLNFKPFLETEVLQKNFLRLSKTKCLCQHHTVLYYLLSRVRRNGLLLPRKNTNPSSCTAALPLSTPKNCHMELYIQFKLFSLLTSHRKPPTHPAHPCSLSSSQWELALPSPPACTHLGAEIPSGTWKTKKKNHRHKHTLFC